MQKRKRPILCYSEFRAKALVRQTITESHSDFKINELVKNRIKVK